MRMTNFGSALLGVFTGVMLASALAYAAVSTLTLGTNGSVGGAVVLNGTSTGSATIQTPAAAGTSTLFQLPGGNGSANQLLQTDGTGVTSWSSTVGTLVGTSESVTLTSNIYTASSADCGKVKLLPTGTTPSVTLPNLNQDCTIVFVTTAAKSYLFNVASGGSKQNSQGFYNTRGTAAGDTVSATITVKNSSAATWNVTGDLTS